MKKSTFKKIWGRLKLVIPHLWFAHRIEWAQKEIEQRPFCLLKNILRGIWKDTKHFCRLTR